VKLPAGIDTISSPTLEPSGSVNTAAVYFSGGFRIPFSLTLATSKLIVRRGGLDISRFNDGPAIIAPAPIAASAATPSAVRRVSLIGPM
jgi:hypothetical protein